MTWLSIEDQIGLALSRKRRMRLIYKWRHGLPHTHQPAHRDRGKLRKLALWREMRPSFDGPIGQLLNERMSQAEAVMAHGIADALVG